jgi:biopolymer transport protein ExbB/TolQ
MSDNTANGVFDFFNSYNGVFVFFNDYIYHIIFTFVIIEVFLSGSIYYLLKRQGMRLNDATDNLLKGFNDAPDKDSGLYTQEKIESSLRFITNKIKSDTTAKEIIRKNAGKVAERSSDVRYFGIELQASMMSTLVQVFPLLGILGTVLNIARAGFDSSGAFDTELISTAFVTAMATTIYGIGFSIIFMLIESALHPKIERIISDSKEYKDIINSVYLS